jgi:hypothetical protein
MRFGEVENGMYAIAATGGVTYAIDLFSFGYGDTCSYPLSITTSTGKLGWRFSNDPNGIVNLAVTSGAQRAMVHGLANNTMDLFPPKGQRYLLFANTVGATVRVATQGPFRPLVGAQALDYVTLYAEGDSNTAIDAPAIIPAYGGPVNKWWFQLSRLMKNRSINALFAANVAQSGSQWTVASGLAPNPIISAPRQTALDAIAKAELVNALIIETSANDINGLGDVLATLQTNMRQWCDNRLAAAKNWRIIPMAIPPQSLDPTKNAICTAYNAWLPDLIGEGRAVAVIGRPTILDNSQNTTYYAPNGSAVVAEHWNENGATVMAGEAFRVLSSVAWPARP